MTIDTDDDDDDDGDDGDNDDDDKTFFLRHSVQLGPVTDWVVRAT